MNEESRDRFNREIETTFVLGNIVVGKKILENKMKVIELAEC